MGDHKPKNIEKAQICHVEFGKKDTELGEWGRVGAGVFWEQLGR